MKKNLKAKIEEDTFKQFVRKVLHNIRDAYTGFFSPHYKFFKKEYEEVARAMLVAGNSLENIPLEYFRGNVRVGDPVRIGNNKKIKNLIKKYKRLIDPEKRAIIKYYEGITRESEDFIQRDKALHILYYLRK